MMEAAEATLRSTDLGTARKKDLSALCRQLGLPVYGLRKQLETRLRAHRDHASSQPAPPSTSRSVPPPLHELASPRQLRGSAALRQRQPRTRARRLRARARGSVSRSRSDPDRDRAAPRAPAPPTFAPPAPPTLPPHLSTERGTGTARGSMMDPLRPPPCPHGATPPNFSTGHMPASLTQACPVPLTASLVPHTSSLPLAPGPSMASYPVAPPTSSSQASLASLIAQAYPNTLQPHPITTGSSLPPPGAATAAPCPPPLSRPPTVAPIVPPAMPPSSTVQALISQVAQSAAQQALSQLLASPAPPPLSQQMTPSVHTHISIASAQRYDPPPLPAQSLSQLQTSAAPTSSATASLPQFAPLCSALPTIPGKFSALAAAGEFVDFTELLHHIDWDVGEEPPVHVELAEGRHLALSKRPRKKGITTFADWVRCFTLYANSFCAYHPQRATDMLGYLFVIASALREFSLPAVLAYDIAFRRKVATFKGTPWGQVDPALYSRAFTGPGKARPNATCPLCLQASHAASECPFYSPGPAKKPRGTPAGPKRTAPFVNGREICLNFNRGRCSSTSCARMHACSVRGCAGPHPSFKCTLRRSSPRKQ